MKKVKEKPLRAYIEARMEKIDYTKLTDQEYETIRNKEAIIGIVEYLEKKYGED